VEISPGSERVIKSYVESVTLAMRRKCVADLDASMNRKGIVMIEMHQVSKVFRTDWWRPTACEISP